MSDTDEILMAIRDAFPVANAPSAEAVVADFVPGNRPVEAEELVHTLNRRPWTDVAPEFIDAHSDWMVYLSPRAFAYFLPAWLVYGLDYHRAGYAADWVVSFFAHPPASEEMSDVQARMINALDSTQKSTVIQWLIHLIAAYPDKDPGYLKQQGLAIEDAVYNLSLRPYDDDMIGYR